MYIRGQRSVLSRVLNSKAISSRRSSVLSSRNSSRSTSTSSNSRSNSSLNQTKLTGTSKLVTRYTEMETAASRIQSEIKTLDSKMNKYSSLLEDKKKYENTITENEKKLTDANETDSEKIKKENSKIEKEIKNTNTELEDCKKDINDVLDKMVTNYNKMFDKVEEMGGTSGYSYTKSLKNLVSKNEKALNEIGISISNKGRLSIDDKSLEKADVEKIKSLFDTKGSFVSDIKEITTRVKSTANVMLKTVDKTSGSTTYDKYGQANTYQTAQYSSKYNSYI